MRRGRALGLAAVLAAAICATATTAASAALPQWNHCGKAAVKNTGDYADKNCTVPTSPGTGAYEVTPGLGKKAIKGTSQGITRLIVAVPEKIEIHLECEKASFFGHGVGKRGFGYGKFKMTKCRWQGGNCNNFTIQTLDGWLGWLDAEEGRVGLWFGKEDLSVPNLLAEVDCEGGVRFRVRGQWIMEIGPLGEALATSHALTGHVGEYLGEPSPGDKPIVNPPAFEEETIGTLETELADPETKGEFTAPYPSGLEGKFALSGVPFSIS